MGLVADVRTQHRSGVGWFVAWHRARVIRRARARRAPGLWAETRRIRGSYRVGWWIAFDQARAARASRAERASSDRSDG